MSESAVSNDIPQRSDGARLRFPRPEDHPFDTSQDQCAGAHRAGFQGHGQRAPFEPPPVAVHSGGRPQRQNLGVSRRVPGGLARIRGTGQFASVGVEDHCADRNVTIGRIPRSSQCRSDQILVDHAGLPRKLVQNGREFVGEAESLCDRTELLVRIEIGFGHDDAQDRFRQA